MRRLAPGMGRSSTPFLRGLQTSTSVPGMTREDIGKLILRLTVAGLMLMHGIAKLRHGIGPIASSVSSHSLPHFVAYGVYLGELIAPLFVLVGIFTRPAAAVIAIDMLFAIWLKHSGELLHVSSTGGYALELQFLYLAGAIAIALFGAGRYALNGGMGRFN
jgi:putative oxidoreductase